MAKNKAHYVNNKEFSQAVMDYAVAVHEARAKDNTIPKVTDYIARCFIKIAEGLYSFIIKRTNSSLP